MGNNAMRPVFVNGVNISANGYDEIPELLEAALRGVGAEYDFAEFPVATARAYKDILENIAPTDAQLHVMAASYDTVGVFTGLLVRTMLYQCAGWDTAQKKVRDLLLKLFREAEANPYARNRIVNVTAEFWKGVHENVLTSGCGHLARGLMQCDNEGRIDDSDYVLRRLRAEVSDDNTFGDIAEHTAEKLGKLWEFAMSLYEFDWAALAEKIDPLLARTVERANEFLSASGLSERTGGTFPAFTREGPPTFELVNDWGRVLLLSGWGLAKWYYAESAIAIMEDAFVEVMGEDGILEFYAKTQTGNWTADEKRRFAEARVERLAMSKPEGEPEVEDGVLSAEEREEVMRMLAELISARDEGGDARTHLN